MPPSLSRRGPIRTDRRLRSKLRTDIFQIHHGIHPDRQVVRAARGDRRPGRRPVARRAGGGGRPDETDGPPHPQDADGAGLHGAAPAGDLSPVAPAPPAGGGGGPPGAGPAGRAGPARAPPHDGGDGQPGGAPARPRRLPDGAGEPPAAAADRQPDDDRPVRLHGLGPGDRGAPAGGAAGIPAAELRPGAADDPHGRRPGRAGQDPRRRAPRRGGDRGERDRPGRHVHRRPGVRPRRRRRRDQFVAADGALGPSSGPAWSRPSAGRPSRSRNPCTTPPGGSNPPCSRSTATASATAPRSPWR